MATSNLLDIWGLDDGSFTRELLMLDLPATELHKRSCYRSSSNKVSRSSSISSNFCEKSSSKGDQQPTYICPTSVVSDIDLSSTLKLPLECKTDFDKASDLDHIACQHCLSENEKETHWCTNCGTVLLHKQDTLSSHESHSNGSQCTADFPRLKGSSDKCIRPKNSQTLKSLLHSDSNMCTENTSGLASKEERRDAANWQLDVRKSSTIPLKANTRHWNTSSTYMWRKPSTLRQQLDEASISRLPNSEDKKDADIRVDSDRTLVPILDLSSVSLGGSTIDSTCTLREKMTANENYKTSNLKSSLEILPDELLLCVMSFLTEKELICCMYVCSRLYFIASDKTLWRDITLRKKAIDQNYLMRLTERCPYLERLTFERCSLSVGAFTIDFNQFFKRLPMVKSLKSVMNNFGPGTGDRLLLSAATHCPQLHTVDFDWTTLTERALQKCIKIITRLESLTIDQHGDISQETLSLLFVQHRQWLKLLNVGMGTTVTVEKVLSSTSNIPVPNLLTFIAAFNTVDLSIFKNLQKVFPSLKHLTIQYYQLSPFPAEISVLLSNKALYSLHFKLYSDFSPACCKSIAQMLTLRELSLDTVDDDGMEVLCSGQLLLEVLDLSNSFITTLSLASIGKSSFRLALKSLKLNGCVGINKKPESISLLLKQCLKLQIIELPLSAPHN